MPDDGVADLPGHNEAHPRRPAGGGPRRIDQQVDDEAAGCRTPPGTNHGGELVGRVQPAAGRKHRASGRTAVRPTARRDPCGGEQPGWRGPHGSASAAGNRGSSHGGGCSAGRCACSRLSTPTSKRLVAPILRLLSQVGATAPKTRSLLHSGQHEPTGDHRISSEYGTPRGVVKPAGFGSPTATDEAARRTRSRHAVPPPCLPRGLVARRRKLLACRPDGSGTPSPPEQIYPRHDPVARAVDYPPGVAHICGQPLWMTYGGGTGVRGSK